MEKHTMDEKGNHMLKHSLARADFEEGECIISHILVMHVQQDSMKSIKLMYHILTEKAMYQIKFDLKDKGHKDEFIVGSLDEAIEAYNKIK